MVLLNQALFTTKFFCVLSFNCVKVLIDEHLRLAQKLLLGLKKDWKKNILNKKAFWFHLWSIFNENGVNFCSKLNQYPAILNKTFSSTKTSVSIHFILLPIIYIAQVLYLSYLLLLYVEILGHILGLGLLNVHVIPK